MELLIMRKVFVFFRGIGAMVRLTVAWSWVVLQLPVQLLLTGWSQRLGVWHMRTTTLGLAKILRIRIRKSGQLSKDRPLLIVANHFSVFEVIVFPAAFGTGFFGKSEIRKWFFIGWLAKSYGNLFIDRRPEKAMQAVELLTRQMRAAKSPFTIYPEGTTSNGNYIMPFKSSMFEFLKDVPDVKIQPVVMFYRDRQGGKIPPQVLADKFAYFSNDKQLQPPYSTYELTVRQLVFNILMNGGLTIELVVLPVFGTAGLGRKEIAFQLHDIISNKFEELK